jgi:DNA-binding GntR family transcriptional regulator
MIAHPKARNLNEDVVRALRDAIGRGQFRDEPVLSEQAFEKYLTGPQLKMKVSRMPIRRAIAHFEAEGILRVVPKVGTVLCIPKPSELREIWDNRVNLEEFIITQLARKATRDLSGVNDVHGQMKKMALGDEFATPTTNEHSQFIALDQDFHEQLAIAAHYPLLAEELNLLRFKLQLAAPVEPFSTKHRFRAIVKEHEDIITTLEGNPDLPELRPDLNAVRLAFLVHMRNSAKQSWKIEQRIRPTSDVDSQDYVFDVPDLTRDEWLSTLGMRVAGAPVWNLLQLRFAIEESAVTQIAMRPDTDLKVLEALHRQMKLLADECAPIAKTLPPSIESRFINLDISFHSALCFLAGMLFGEDVVNYVWHMLHSKADFRLDARRIKEIIDEHEAIVMTLKDSRGKPGDVDEAVRALKAHMTQAFVRNNFDADMLSLGIKQGNEFLEALLEASKNFQAQPAESRSKRKNVAES